MDSYVWEAISTRQIASVGAFSKHFEISRSPIDSSTTRITPARGRLYFCRDLNLVIIHLYNDVIL